jgi:hypothetical protein
MLRCAEFVDQVTTVEDGAAPTSLRLAFQLHRLVCSHCRRYLRQMRVVRSALRRRTASDEPPPSPDA